MRYFKKITGKYIYLSPVNPEDTELYTKWINDPAVGVNLGVHSRCNSLSNERKILEDMAANGHNFAIILSQGDRLLGNISLMDVDHLRQSATVGLFIGEAEDRGKGYGGEALRLIVDYGFCVLNLHNIQLHVDADNYQGVACYQKVGFREFGRRREAVFKDGRRIDLIHMDILSTEWQGIMG